MKESGFWERGMELANNLGLMGHVMKDNGRMIKVVVGVNYYMQTEMCMKVNGEMIKRMEKGFMFILMVPDMKAM